MVAGRWRICACKKLNLCESQWRRQAWAPLIRFVISIFKKWLLTWKWSLWRSCKCICGIGWLDCPSPRLRERAWFISENVFGERRRRLLRERGRTEWWSRLYQSSQTINLSATTTWISEWVGVLMRCMSNLLSISNSATNIKYIFLFLVIYREL